MWLMGVSINIWHAIGLIFFKLIANGGINQKSEIGTLLRKWCIGFLVPWLFQLWRFIKYVYPLKLVGPRMLSDHTETVLNMNSRILKWFSVTIFKCFRSVEYTSRFGEMMFNSSGIFGAVLRFSEHLSMILGNEIFLAIAILWNE